MISKRLVHKALQAHKTVYNPAERAGLVVASRVPWPSPADKF